MPWTPGPGATPGPDVYIGTEGDDVADGLAGDDRLTGGLGADTLTGGAGADVFVYLAVAESPIADGGGNPNDFITDFQTGIDRIDLSAVVGAGGAVAINRSGVTSTIYFKAAAGAVGKIAVAGIVQAADLITAATVSLYITGGAGADALVGGLGADVITGGGGADILTGGAGADTFVYRVPNESTQTSADRLTDFATGIDKIDLSIMLSSLQANANRYIAISLNDAGQYYCGVNIADGFRILSDRPIYVRDFLAAPGSKFYIDAPNPPPQVITERSFRTRYF